MSTETWDYMAAAAGDYLAVLESNGTEEAEPTAFGRAIPFFLSKVASDSAIEFARLLQERVPAEHARMSVQLTMDHHYAMEAAREIIPFDYDEWRTEREFGQQFPSAQSDGQ